MIRLFHLERMFAELPVAAELSRALGYNPVTLYRRVRRGSPEITVEESRQIEAKLAAAGLRLEIDPEAG